MGGLLRNQKEILSIRLTERFPGSIMHCGHVYTRQKVNNMITPVKMIGVNWSQQVMKWGNL